uniref:Uncharacterized protein n=1 Tax=Knipowitschia caucasica TaxID=637954 RepID=A0AAV2MKD3_KNICA
MTSLPYDLTALRHHCPMTSLPYDITALQHHCPMTSLPYDITALRPHRNALATFGRGSEPQPTPSPSTTSGLSNRETKDTVAPETVATAGNMLDPLIPSQAINNELLVGAVTLPSRSLPSRASPLHLLHTIPVLLLLLNLFNDGQ